MIKTFKKAISIFLIASFVLSLVPVGSFASVESHPGMLDDAKSLIPVSTKSGWQKYETVSDCYLGGKGEPYSLWGDSAGAPRREILVSGCTGAQDVLEFSMYIPSDSQGMSLTIGTYAYPNPSESNFSELPLVIQNDGIYSNFSSGLSKMVAIDAADKWLNLAFVSPDPYDDSAASNSKAMKIYVNGVLEKEHDTTYSKSGFRHLRLNARGGTSALEPVVYVDNVRIYSGAYQPQYDVVDEISYVNGIEDSALLLKGITTVAQLKEGITKKTDTAIRVYKTNDSTNPLSDEEIVEEGYVVVAAAKNNADMERSYSYYTTANYVKKYPDLNDGSNTGLHALKRKSGTSGTQKFEILTENLAGKENDKYMLWSDSDGTYQRQIPLNCSEKQDTLELSFLIPSGSKGFTIGQHLSNVEGTGATGITLWFRPDGIYKGWSETAASKLCPLVTDQWYNFAIVTPTPYSDGTEPGIGTTTIYLNGKAYPTNTNNTKTGFRYLNIWCKANGSLVPAVCLDNIRTHNETYEPEYDVVDEISYVGGIEDGTILTNGNITVGELKSGITKKEDTTIRVYKTKASTAILSDEEIVRDGYIVVAAAKNKTGMDRSYNYYTTGKYVKKYPGINAGTTILTKSETSSKYSDYYSMESQSNKLGGNDGAYLLMADSSGVRRAISLDDASGKQDVFEMSVYIPSNSAGITLDLYFTDLSGGPVSLPILIKADGLYTNFSGGPSRFYTLEPDKWYNLAFVTPEPYVDSADENSNVLKIYVNGKLIDSRGTTYTRSGFRNKIFIGSIQNDSTHKPSAYLDNIRVHSLLYESEYDAFDHIGYKDGVDANNIIVKGKTTVGELKTGITKKEDTTIRVYKNILSTQVLSDGAYIDDGYVVVASAKNGSEMERSYNYYTINKIKNEVKIVSYANDTASKTYGAGDDIFASADFYNYTDAETFNVTMYAAQYKYGELINLWQSETKTVAAENKETFTCDFEGIGDLENSSIKIMFADDNLNPYSKAEKMRYKDPGLKATLYLMGDSIVQTYIDAGYPIQGWGYYIKDYLNENITVENRATSGWTTDHYLYPDGIYTRHNGVDTYGTELTNTKGVKKVVSESNRYKTWENIKSTLKAGDYVIVSLGINDAGSGNVSEARYRENIETIYNEASSIGARVIFTTPTITGRDWNDTAGFRQDYIGRGNICRSVAESHNSVWLPLGAELIKTYDAMVSEYQVSNPGATLVEAKNYVRNYFHLYGASSTNPPSGWDDFGSKTTDDDMHHNVVGSNKVASIVAKLLAESDSPLGDYVVISE